MTTTAPTTAPTITSGDLAGILSRSNQYRINASMLQALCAIHAGGADSLTITSVARALDLSTAALTQLADGLEKRGLIARRNSVSDRRVIWLDLTERGQDALTDILTPA